MNIVTGWGQTSANGTFNNILQQAIVPVWNQSKCRDAYSKFGIHITENQLCAGYDNGGTDACQVGIFQFLLMDTEGISIQKVKI